MSHRAQPRSMPTAFTSYVFADLTQAEKDQFARHYKFSACEDGHALRQLRHPSWPTPHQNHQGAQP